MFGERCEKKNGNDKVCIIMDNVAQHKSKAVVEGIQRDRN